MKTEIHQIFQQNTDRIQRSEDEVRSLNNNSKNLEEKADESEEYSTRDTINLSDDVLYVWSTTANCTQVAMDKLENKLKVTINPGDMSIALRFEKKLANNPERPQILVKICRRDLKADLIGPVKTVKPSNFYTSESIIPQSQTNS